MRTIRLFMWLLMWSGCTWGVGASGCGGDVGIEKPVCVPVTCATMGATCGSIDDGCGNRLRCGGCPSHEMCAATLPNTCGQVCAKGGWCWEYPLPHGFNLNGVWQSAPDDAWAVGDDGFAMHYDGETWSKVDVGTGSTLWSVWGSAPDDVWIAAGAMLHYDGRTWSAVTDADAGFTRVDGTARDVAYAFGSSTLSRWDGTAWREVSDAGFSYVLDFEVLGADDVVACGQLGASGPLVRFNGQQWEDVSSLPAGWRVWDIDRRGSELWAVGALPVDAGIGTTMRFDGVEWRDLGPPGFRPDSLTVNPTGEVWVSDGTNLAVRDGEAWRTVARPDGSQARLAAGATDGVWTFGRGGYLARRSAGRWEVFGGAPEERFGSRLWASGRDDVWWTAPKADAMRWDGRQLARMPQQPHSVTGSSATDIWVLDGRPGVLRHFDGASWSQQPVPGTEAFTQVWSESPTRAWAIRPGSLDAAEWDGVSWNARTLPVAFKAIHGSSGKNLWGIGYDDAAYQFDGAGTWNKRLDAPTWGPLPTRPWAIWAFSPDDVLIASSFLGAPFPPVLLFSHVTASGVESQGLSCETGCVVDQHHLWARAPDDVWAAPYFGELLHWDGRFWRREVAPLSRERHEALYGAQNELWLATSSGGLLHKVR